MNEDKLVHIQRKVMSDDCWLNRINFPNHHQMWHSKEDQPIKYKIDHHQLRGEVRLLATGVYQSIGHMTIRVNRDALSTSTDTESDRQWQINIANRHCCGGVWWCEGWISWIWPLGSNRTTLATHQTFRGHIQQPQSNLPTETWPTELIH